MKGKIRLTDPALEEIIRSAWETKDVESTGYLYGRHYLAKGISFWYISFAHAMQLAERTPNGCNSFEDGNRHCYHFYQDVGGFHSHPTSRKQKNGIRKKSPGRVYLSKDGDIPNLKERLEERPHEIEIVVGLRKANKIHDLPLCKYLVSYYLHDLDTKKNYRIQIGGYYLDNGRVRKAEILVSKRASKVVWW